VLSEFATAFARWISGRRTCGLAPIYLGELDDLAAERPTKQVIHDERNPEKHLPKN
jgi:hypothetical protein